MPLLLVQLIPESGSLDQTQFDIYIAVCDF